MQTTDIEHIIAQVASFFGYTTEDVMRKDIKRDVSNARNFIFYTLHFKYGISSNEIAKIFNRDKRNITRRNATTKYRVDNFKDYRQTYIALEATL